MIKTPHTTSQIFILLATIQLFLIFAFAGMLGAASWQFDEYFALDYFQKEGFRFFWHRLTTWSPRPFSELLVYLYASIVNLTKMQLIPFVMGLLWGSLLLSISLNIIWFKETSIQNAIRLLFATLPILLTLCSTKTGELFYWPFGSLAYMPTLSALVVMFAILTWGNIDSYALPWTISCLILAASSEMGAFFILFFSGFITLIYFFQKKISQPATIIWLKLQIPALLISIGVVLGLIFGRLGNKHETHTDPEASHNILTSIFATLPEFLTQLISNGTIENKIEATPILIKLCLGVFVFYLTPGSISNISKKPILASFGLACIATIWFTIFAAFYQFGTLCCERHDSVRYYLSLLFISTFAIFAAHCIKNINPKLTHTLPLLACLILTLYATTASSTKLLPEYRDYALTRKINADNWLFNNTPPFIFINNKKYSNLLNLSHTPEKGLYTSNSEKTPEFNLAILHYFDIKTINFQEKIYTSTNLSIDKIPEIILNPTTKWQTMLCTIDKIDIEHLNESKTGTINTKLTIAGWLNLPDIGVNPNKSTILLKIRTQESQKDIYFPLKLSDRFDVANHFQRSDLLQSGLISEINIPFGSIKSLDIEASDGIHTGNCQLQLP